MRQSAPKVVSHGCNKNLLRNRLRELREAAGYSREHVAVAIRRSWHSIYQFERDELRPGREAQEAFAALLNCRIDDLYVENGSDAE